MMANFIDPILSAGELGFIDRHAFDRDLGNDVLEIEVVVVAVARGGLPGHAADRECEVRVGTHVELELPATSFGLAVDEVGGGGGGESGLDRNRTRWAGKGLLMEAGRDRCGGRYRC